MGWLLSREARHKRFEGKTSPLSGHVEAESPVQPLEVRACRSGGRLPGSQPRGLVGGRWGWCGLLAVTPVTLCCQPHTRHLLFETRQNRICSGSLEGVGGEEKQSAGP